MIKDKKHEKNGKTNVRREAFLLLLRMETEGVYSNIAIDAVIRRSEMGENDRALFTVLVLGVTERRLTLDYYINSLSKLPPEKISTEVRCILRIGLYQILYLDRIPDHAAVSESVALCKSNRGAAGFVNALLRRAAAEKDRMRLPDKAKKPYRYLSVVYSFPIPLCRRFCEIFGFERTEKILGCFERARNTVLRVNTLKLNREKLIDELAEAGIHAETGKYSASSVALCGGKMPDLSDPAGRFFVEGEASQIAVEVLHAGEGDNVIDMCSAPGGKSFGAAMYMRNKGRVYAFDLHSSKLAMITDGAKRLGIDIITAKEADSTVFIPELEGTADRVICDVPCSGFGVCAKKPEIRYRSLDECAALPELQLAIAENAARYLKAGGRMVYSTCTLLPEENEQVVRRLLEKNEELRTVDFAVGECVSDGGMLTLTPDINGTDGFFIALIEKRAEYCKADTAEGKNV